MLNQMTLCGRLTRDPELKYTPQNIAVCTITVAVDRDYVKPGQERQADFIDLVCWQKLGEFVSRNFKKGQMITAQGRLQSRKWTDKDGKNRINWEVIGAQVYFAGAAPGTESKAANAVPPATGAAAQAGMPVQRGWPEYNEPGDEFAAIDDDDVPF